MYLELAAVVSLQEHMKGVWTEEPFSLAMQALAITHRSVNQDQTAWTEGPLSGSEGP